MKYRYMGKTGLLVSRLTLGTMTFGTKDWGADEAKSHAILKAFIDGGGNIIDTADMYAGGRSEEIIGSFLPQIQRDDVTIASKSYFPMGPQPNQQGLSRKHIIASCEASLRRLGTDYIDLYYMHGPDPITPLEESMRALDDLVRAGKVRYLGCSNMFGWQIAKANGIAARLNLEPLVAGQYLYNLIHREAEREIIPAAVDSGMGIMTYSPLAAGLLTGKYKEMAEPQEGSRLSYRSKVDGPRFWHPKGFERAQMLEEVANEAGVSMAKLAIAWAFPLKYVASVIFGARTVEQLHANMEAADWDMPDDVWQTLQERSQPEEEYLTWFNRHNYARYFDAVEFYDSSRELP